jgi:hypothetical protein
MDKVLTAYSEMLNGLRQEHCSCPKLIKKGGSKTERLLNNQDSGFWQFACLPKTDILLKDMCVDN